MSRINEPHIVIGVELKGRFYSANGNRLRPPMAVLSHLTVVQLTQFTERSYKPNTLLDSKNSKTRYIFNSTNQLLQRDLEGLQAEAQGYAG